jgi:hypothetical protein
MRKQKNTNIETGEMMNASELTEDQIDYICRRCLSPMLADAQDTKRKARKDDVNIIYANAQIEKIEQIFRTVGYWKEKGK